MARPPADHLRNLGMPLPAVTLVLGGARSGKSRFAENLVTATPGPRVYLATGEAGDPEMAARIRHHRERRGEGWSTVEEPLDLTGALHRAAGEGATILVDCLTLWISNLMAAGRDVAAETEQLVAALPKISAPIVFVSNEVGLGIVPDNALARAFRDEAGRANQAVAAAADRVYFIAAGLPLVMKDEATVASIHRIERKNARP
jgi:adenosylcobinamide kinase/adenosylcobinamide-phosphate guanylyltransferase